MKRKYKWGIVSDIIRELANPSNHNIGLNQTENENALNDMADIMDTMMMNNCSFDKAVKIERDGNDEFAAWLEDILENIWGENMTIKQARNLNPGDKVKQKTHGYIMTVETIEDSRNLFTTNEFVNVFCKRDTTTRICCY